MNINIVPTLMVKLLVRSAFFFFSFLFPINEKRITFASYRAEKLEGNLLFVYKEMEQRFPDFEYRFLFKRYNSTLLGKFKYVIHMLRATYLLATSKFFLVDDFYFPVYVITPRKGTEIIQLWHAAGAFKKFGYSIVDKPYGPSREYLKHVKVHSNYSRVYVSSENVVPFYAEAFNMPQEQVYPLGLPRTDFFFQDNKKEKLLKKFKRNFPYIKNKKLILYAPTFRGSSHYQKEFDFPIDISVLRSMVGSSHALIVHLHPFMKMNLEIDENDKDFVCHVNGQMSIEELLAITDILITDYSSIIFDFSILCRPIAFFANDLEEYIGERDFYYSYMHFIPGPFFTETEKLGEWIKSGAYDYDKIYAFRNYFFDYLDGKASKRIVDHLLFTKK